MRSQAAKTAGWMSIVSPVAPAATSSTPPSTRTSPLSTSQNDGDKKTRQGGRKKSDDVQKMYGVTDTRDPESVTVDNQSRQGSKVEAKEGLTKEELVSIRSGIENVRLEMRVARDRMKELEETAAKREAWSADITKQMQQVVTQSGLSAVADQWQQDLEELTNKVEKQQVQIDESITNNIDTLKTDIHARLEACDKKLSQHIASTALEVERVEQHFNSMCTGIKKALAEQATQEQLKEVQAAKVWETLFRSLEFRVEGEMKRVSQEHHEARKMHSTYFQDSQDAMAAALKADLAQLSSDLGAKLDHLQSSRPSVTAVETMLQEACGQEANERSRTQGELQRSLEDNISNLRGFAGELDSRLSADAQQRSDERRQDKREIQRQMHHCMGLIMPSMSTEPRAELYPREEVEFPTTLIK